MPPEPIELQVIQHLQAALQAITIAGGYHYDVAAAAVKLDPNQDVEALLAPGGARPFIVIDVAPETWQYEPASQVLLALPLTIHWVQDSDPTVDLSRLQTYLRGCADVERAIAVDVTRGGLAADTRIVKRVQNTEADGALVWAALDVEITVHRTYGAPDA